jgi:mono/diheme cytochrome c family protein/glucose/arabinose dehydrogenase
VLVILLTVPFQAGDVAGEAQPDPSAELAAPPAPVRSPEEERATFALADGLELELVASEPLLGDPVQAVFDATGDLWVCEMRGYMPDVDGTDEAAPVGAIAVLSDTDGDGRMDTRTVFLDELVLPRAIAPCHGGALVLAPPELFFARDTDGDGRADEREVVLRDLGGITSPEHAPNGLDFGLDNAWRLANSTLALRHERGAWTSFATAGGGQWGLSQDELGRAFFNTNWEPLRGDLYPSRYAARNPNLGPAAGANVSLCDDARTFPSRTNLGVNRGYRAGTLRADGTLAVVTAACAPFYFRGDALPRSHREQIYVCEPAGNLVLRYALEEDGLALRARRAEGERDFLTSTDERFRPVNLTSGPDGALYVVDMYRGVIQHRLFVTSYLRRQVEARGLGTPIGLGRIWRVRGAAVQVAGEGPRGSPVIKDAATNPAGAVCTSVLPAGASDAELVALLDHPNGWTRDTSRRLLIEGSVSETTAASLRARVLAGGDRSGRLQALSVLAELTGLDDALARKLLDDTDPELVLAMLRRIETRLGAEPFLSRALELGRSPHARLAHQVLLSLAAAATPAADAGLRALLAQDCTSEERRTAALSGLGGRELEFLSALLADDAWRAPGPTPDSSANAESHDASGAPSAPGSSAPSADGAPRDETAGDDASIAAAEASGRARLLGLLAACIVREGRLDRRAGFVDLLPKTTPWQRAALVRGATSALPAPTAEAPAPIHLAHEPAALAPLAALPGTAPLLAALSWPGHPAQGETPPRALTADELARFTAGRALYVERCTSCHLASGQGDPGKAPTLRGSPRVLGAPEPLVALLLHGLTGPVPGFSAGTASGATAEMPALAATDNELAALTTYLRREWGHAAEPVTLTDVSRARAWCAARASPWTLAALAAAHPPAR